MKDKLSHILYHTIFLLFVLTFYNNLSAQDIDTITSPDRSTESLLKKLYFPHLSQHGFNIFYDTFSGHWSGIDFGFNFLTNNDYTGYNSEFMDNDIFRSNSTFINLIQQSIGLQRNRNTIGIVTGIGFHLQSYRLGRNTTIRKSDNDRIIAHTLFFDENQKSKLSIVSLTVPLLLEFQIPVNHYKNRIYFSAGMLTGIRLSSHTKIKYRIDGKKEKLKIPGDFSLQDIKYDLMFRTGYRWLNIFCTYQLNPLFKNDKGPNLTPVTLGVTLIKF